MQKAEPQPAKVQNQPASQQRGGGVADSPQAEQIAQLEAMVAASSHQAALQKMADGMHNSLRQRTAQNFLEGINNSPKMVAQRMRHEQMFGVAQLEKQAEAKPNNTGLPDNLKSGIENLSGMSMDNVKVHYNSDQPAQLNALAYAQGSDIHLAPGQEQHLPHEAWHVVQQAQGRVQPTMQMKEGMLVNDDKGLEHEADVMGARALESAAQRVTKSPAEIDVAAGPVMQRYVEVGGGVSLSENSVFAVRGEGKGNELFVKAGTPLPAFQHVALQEGGDTLKVSGVTLVKVDAEYENEDELAKMYCGKFSEMVTGVKESEENETATSGRSLYVDSLYDLEGDYDGAWQNHFAPVVVADGSDRGTLETAVGIDYIWHGIYGKSRGQSFRYKTAVADVALQLSRQRVSPEQAREVLGYLALYVKDGIPDKESITPQILDEVLKIETALKSLVEIGFKEPKTTELGSAKEAREKREGEERKKRYLGIVDDISQGKPGWEDQVKQVHKYTMRALISEALTAKDLTEDQVLRLQQAMGMVQESMSNSSISSRPESSGLSGLQVLGGLSILAIVGGLLYYAKYKRS